MTNGTIDSLDIQIGASSEGVVRQLNNIARAMTAIKAASAGNVGRGLQEAIRTINNLSVQKVGALADALGKLKGISINSKLADNLMDFEAAVSLIAEKKGAVESIERICSALGNLNGVNLSGFSGAVDKAKREAEKVKKETDKIAKEAAKQQSRQQTGTREIRRPGGETKKTTPFGNQMLKHGESLSKLDLMRAKLAEMRVEFAKKIRLGELDDKDVISAVEKIQNLKKQIEDLQKNTSIGNQFKSMFKMPETSSFNQKWGWDLKQNFGAVGALLSSHIHPAIKLAASVIGGIASVLKKVAKTVWNIAKGIAKWAFHTAVEALKKMWNLLKKMPGAIAKVVGTVGKGLGAAGKGLASFMWEHSPVNKLTDSFERLKKVLSSFTRVAFYRIVRSAIKFVTDALEEGSNNAYYFAKKFGDSTKYISENMDILATSTGKMRNQVGAAWATLIATVEPLLLRLLELVTRAASIVTQFFGAMGGKSTYLKAKSFPKTWAEDAEDAADKTKEWKNQLMDFDTLNRLNEKLEDAKDESNLPNYEEMFEEVPIEPWISELSDLLKLENLLGDFDTEKWYTVGLRLGNSLNDLLGKLDKKIIDITPKLENVAKKLANLLNGLIDGVDWELLGKTVGDGLNAIFRAIDTFLTNTRWKDLGRGVGTALKSLFDTVDWDLVGSTFAHGWNALLHFIEGVVTTPGIWESMGRSIGEFVHAWFREIDINSLATSLIAIINGVATAIENFLAQDPFANIAEKLTNAIQRIITEVRWGYVGEQFGKLFQEVLNQINTVIFGTNWVAFGTSLGTMLNNFIANIDFNMLGQTLVGVFTSALNILYGVLITPGFAANLATSLSNFMLGALTQLADWLKSLSPAMIAGAIRDFFGNIKYEEIKDAFVRVVRSAWTLAMSVKEDLFPDGLLPTVAGHISSWIASVNWESVGNTISTNFSKAWTWATNTLDKIWPSDSREAFLKQAVKVIVDIGWEVGKRFAEAIVEKFSEWWNGSSASKIFSFIRIAMDPHGRGWMEIYKQFKDAGKESGTSVVNGFSGQSGKFTEAGKSAVESFGSGWKSKWNEFQSSALTLVQTLVNGISDAVNRGFSGFTTAVGTAVSAARTKLQEFAGSAMESINTVLEQGKTNLNGIVSSIQSAVNNIISQANSILSGMRAKRYATGGFPEDGLFYANHGELVGKFSNGKTAVANNEQIISGIEQGVYRAVSMAMGMSRNSDDGGGVINVYVGDELVYSGYSKWNKRQQLMAGGRA